MSGALLAAVIVLTYANSLSGVFIYDDLIAIPENSTIRNIERIGEVLSPPRNATVTARPLANLTLAVNYLVGGVNPIGYHIVNMLIHAGAALLLLGIVRRTLLMPAVVGRWGGDAHMIALLVALLWAVHPLQTESVTYVVQRVESLAGLFYLLTLYSFIRGNADGGVLKWRIMAVASCWLGMATKETMVSAPLMVLLYDRTFISGTFGGAWRRGRVLYITLFGSWFLLAGLVIKGSGRDNTAGFDAGITSWHYLLTQCGAITQYLRLSVWPDPLVFDYGRAVVRVPMEVLWQGILLSVLAFAAGWAVWKRHWLGFVGVWFFATLAPSSSIVPIVTQTMAEHRMYLPLASVCLMFVVLVYRWAGRYSGVILCMIASAFCVMTIYRNEKYGSALVLWQDTVEKRPEHSGAQNNLGNALVAAGRAQEAIPHFQRALEITNGKDADVHNNLGRALVDLKRPVEAELCFRKALEVNSRHVIAMCNLGWMYSNRSQWDEAESIFVRALQIRPDFAEALHGLGFVASKRNQTQLALSHYNAAVLSDPHNAKIWTDLGITLLKLGRLPESEKAYRQAVAIESASVDGWFGLGCVYSDSSRWAEAAVCYERALHIKADHAEAHNNLASVFLQLGRTREALEHYKAAIRIDPQLVQAQMGLATLLAQAGKYSEAIVGYEAALKLIPNDYEAHRNLGLAYQLLGDTPKALIQYREALRIHPEDAVTLERLKVIVDKP